MILYLTYNDHPSGVYWSQVTDVVEHFNTLGDERVRLVALVSLRGFLRSRREIREQCPDAIVLPMVPRARNWRANRIWLALLCRMYRPTAIIGRGIFASALALKERGRGRVRKVCFDGRAAYGAEWEEFRMVEDEGLIKESARLEGHVVAQVDVRMAVSSALVEHWRERFDYKGDRHVVIPCTLGRAVEFRRSLARQDVRGMFGWGPDDVVLVYSGTIVGWQSIGLLCRTMVPWLASDPTRRLLFLSETHPEILALQARFPDQVARRWVDHWQVRGLLLDCDHGLLLRDRCITNKVSSPTKFAEYLGVGLSVIISEQVGDFSRMVEEHGLGVVLRERGLPPLFRPGVEERQRTMDFMRSWFTKEVHSPSYTKVLGQLHAEQREWTPEGTSNDDAPLVSIIVPSFNKSTFIGDTIRSVMAQTDGRWELLLVDDRSTDGSGAIMAALAAEDPRIRLTVLEENRGANYCRNVGIAQARGRYVIFLDADDKLAPHCVKQRLAVMKGSGLDMAVFTMEVFQSEVGDHGQRWLPDSSDPLRDFLCHDLPWQTMQPIWDRELLVELQGFDEGFTRHQDVEFHTRALLRPGFRYRLFGGAPDCHYRIGEERKVIDPLPLLYRFSDSAVRYHDKFHAPARAIGRERLLHGIIFRTYLQVLMNVKAGKVDRKALRGLEDVLLAPVERSGRGKLLFRVVRWYNLLPVRLPGVNFVLFKLLTR